MDALDTKKRQSSYNENRDYLVDNVGKLFLVGFDGTTITTEVVSLVTEFKVSSMILSGRNFVNVRQTKRLIQDIQLLAQTSGYEYPIIFAIDEEGGSLNSLFDKDYITQFPGAMALAATGSEELVYQVYKKMALELQSIGFSLYLGPVLDVLKDNGTPDDIIGVRAFGYTVNCVSKFARAAAKAFKDVGMFNCAKHFPGYGCASVNSNFDLPMVLDTPDQLMESSLVPYKRLILDGLLDSVLVGGCAVPRVNGNDIHACMSPTVVTHMLREQLNFDGVVLSECMLLEALDKTFGVIQGCISTLSVSCDLIMLCHNYKIQEEAINAVKTVILDDLVDKKIIKSSLKRVKELQKRLPSWITVLNRADLAPKQLEENRLLSKLAYEKSITIVRDIGLPITNVVKPNVDTENTILLLTPLLSPLYETVDELGRKSHINSPEKAYSQDLQYGEDVFIELGKLLANYQPGYKFIHTSYNSNGLSSFHEDLILKSKIVLFVSAKTTKNMYQIGASKHVSMLCKQQPAPSEFSTKNSYCTSSRQMIIISVASPIDFLYDINLPCGYICTYDYTINALSIIPRILFGDLLCTGKIPGINIPNKKNIDTNRRFNYGPIADKSNGGHSWLVETFDFQRDWNNLVTLFKNNGIINFSSNSLSLKHYENLFKDYKNQRSFVIRNTSSNVILGASVTWVYKLSKEEKSMAKILLLLVDRNKRNIGIGKHLYSKTRKFLIDECKCSYIFLGSDFPQILINSLLVNPNEDNKNALNFFKYYQWDFNLFHRQSILNFHSPMRIAKDRNIRYLMQLEDVSSWKVSENLVRQLQVVGIVFDIPRNPQDVLSLFLKKGDDSAVLDDDQGKCVDLTNYEIYSELNKDFQSKTKKFFDNSGNLDIIISLEPTRKQIVGSLILFTNKSKFVDFYPYLSAEEKVYTNWNKSSQGFACITGLFIDPLYSTLSEVFKLGLICTALMYIKRNHSYCSSCFITDIGDKEVKSLQDNGFQIKHQYHNFYSEITNNDFEQFCNN